MASRAISKIKPDWSKLANQLNKNELPKLNKLKSQIDGTTIKVASLPDNLPKIDWAYYKQHASNPKIVDEIEKKYAAMKIEHPKAPSARLNDLKVAQQQDEDRYKKFTVIAQSYIESAAIVQKKFENMIPVPDMTQEDWALTFPEWSYSDIDNPSLVPHLGRAPGLTREEAAAFEQPDCLPYATKTAWKDWEVTKKKYFSD